MRIVFDLISRSAGRPAIAFTAQGAARRFGTAKRTCLMVLALVLGGCATGTGPKSYEGRHVVIGHGVDAPRTLLLQPVSGARLTSTFGPRRDPFTGRRRPHNGIDYAAAVGTPVGAAGDGVVVSAGRRGNYGYYVRIRHDDRHATAYAHLSGYAPHLARGVRVAQGEVIGYVGSSGRSTGPHLHYEVLRDGAQVDPFAIDASFVQTVKGGAIGAARSAGDAFSDVRDRLSGFARTLEENVIGIGGGDE